MGITVPHFRHFIFAIFPVSLSSGIWYLAEQLGQLNFMKREMKDVSERYCRRRKTVSPIGSSPVRHTGYIKEDS